MISETERITETFYRATSADLRQGSDWYNAAHTFCIGLADRYGISVRQAAGIVASLSPQTGWAENMRRADHLCRTEGCAGLSRNVAKARAILFGQVPEDVLAPKCSAGYGPKVRAFYANILDPENPEPVTVDRHAYVIAYGTENGISRIGRQNGYDRVACLYRETARDLGLRPNVLQAVTWTCHRREKGSDWHDTGRKAKQTETLF